MHGMRCPPARTVLLVSGVGSMGMVWVVTHRATHASPLPVSGRVRGRLLSPPVRRRRCAPVRSSRRSHPPMPRRTPTARRLYGYPCGCGEDRRVWCGRRHTGRRMRRPYRSGAGSAGCAAMVMGPAIRISDYGPLVTNHQSPLVTPHLVGRPQRAPIRRRP
jgi:hypothetical protein